MRISLKGITAAKRADKEKVGRLEVFFGRRTSKFVESGKLHPEHYEQFSIRRLDFAQSERCARQRCNPAEASKAMPSAGERGEGIIWFCFPGIDAPDSA